MISVFNNTMRIFVLVLLSITISYGQSSEKLKYSLKEDYHSEFIYGINKNSSGGLIGGFFAKISKRKKDRVFRTYGLEIVNVKNSQETRRSSAASGNMFIFGKTNYLYSFRFQYGRDLLLFQNAPMHGVEVKLVGAVGPTIGLLCPYYIERAVNGNYNKTVTERYDPDSPYQGLNNILGAGGPLQGLGESKFQLGVNIKLGLNFELGGDRKGLFGFEFGFLFDQYVKKPILMPTAKNSSSFPTVYVSIFYGRRRF